MNRHAALRLAPLLALLLLAPLLAQETEPGTTPGNEPALELVDEIAKQVAEIRKLEFKEPFARKIISPEEVKKLAMEMIEEEMPAEDIEGFTLLYARLGFWKSSVDIIESFTDFLEAGAAGLYDPDSKTMYLVKGASVEGAKPVLFHELVHALEDQYFSLGERSRKHRDNSDRESGVTAVVEGSASWLMNVYLEQNKDVRKAMAADLMGKMKEQARMILTVPVPIVAGVGFFPYGNAPKFLKEVTKGDVGKIAAIYEDEPASTEQVLHPEKYGEGGDFPVEVTVSGVAEVLPEGWAAGSQDTMGELQIGLLLNEFLGGPPFGRLMRIASLDNSVTFRTDTRRASEGWDGDRAYSFTGPDRALGVVWASRWDTPKDATEFAEAYAAGLPYKWGDLGQEPKTALIQVRGDRVLIVDGFPEAILEQVAAAAWKGAAFRPDERDEKDKEIPTSASGPVVTVGAKVATEERPPEKKTE